METKAVEVGEHEERYFSMPITGVSWTSRGVLISVLSENGYSHMIEIESKYANQAELLVLCRRFKRPRMFLCELVYAVDQHIYLTRLTNNHPLEHASVVIHSLARQAYEFLSQVIERAKDTYPDME